MASALHHSVVKYKEEDNECAVFYKIIKNEVDEEFRFVQKQLKETVADLLKVHLKGKYQSKLDSEVQMMYQKKIESVLVVCLYGCGHIKTGRRMGRYYQIHVQQGRFYQLDSQSERSYQETNQYDFTKEEFGCWQNLLSRFCQSFT